MLNKLLSSTVALVILLSSILSGLVSPVAKAADGEVIFSTSTLEAAKDTLFGLGRSTGTGTLLINGKTFRNATDMTSSTNLLDMYTSIKNLESSMALRSSGGAFIPVQDDKITATVNSSGLIEDYGVYLKMPATTANLELLLQNYAGTKIPTAIEGPLEVKPLNAKDDVTYFLDFLTLRMFETFVKTKDKMSLDDLTAFVNKVGDIKDEDNVERWYSPYLPVGLEKISKDNKLGKNVSSITDMISYMQESLVKAQDTIAQSIGDNIVAERYTNNILTKNFLESGSSEYDKYKSILYAVSAGPYSKDVQSSLETKVAKYIGSVSSPIDFVNGVDSNAQMLNMVLSKVVRTGTGLTSTQQKQLVSIAAQRGSNYSVLSSNGFRYDRLNLTYPASQGMPLNQAVQAEAALKELLEARANNNGDTTTKQMYTINFRLQYHYWAMQGNPTGTSTANDLSRTLDGRTFFIDIEPLTVDANFVSSQEQYDNFMNVVNEIPNMREVFMKGLGGNLLANAGGYENFIEQIIYLRQLKNGITFLEGITSDGINVKPVVDYWYEKVDVTNGGKTGQMSLEDLYNKTQELGLDVDSLDPFKEAEDTKPLRSFFDLDSKEINDYLKIGIAQSATYTPMKTNVYDPYSYRTITNDGFYKFHYQWGYYRKALYIDTNVKSAVDRYNTGKKGKLKVATMDDLLQPEKDIVLYIDDNFYNVNKLAEMQQKTLDRLSNSTESSNTSFWGRIWDWTTQIFSIDIMEITKSAEKEKYSSSLSNITTYSKATGDKYGDDASDVQTSKNYSVLGKEGIDKYLTPIKDDKNSPTKYSGEAEYSVVQPFAFVSSVYRDKALYTFLNSHIQLPVFISSSDLYSANRSTEYDKGSLLNYALLKNLESNMTIGYSSNMDRNSPIYMDIYGNILSESGIVIVPSAANATMQEKYNPYTTAFLTSYGNSYKLPTTYKNVGASEDGEEAFVPILQENKQDKVWEFQNKAVGFNTKVDINNVSTSSKESMSTLYNIFYTTQFKSSFKADLYISNVFMEVVRGAPIENIDKDFENLNTNRDVSRSGIINGVKLDNLKKSLDMNSQNTILAIPNIAFLDNVEYIILFLYKIMMVLCIILILMQIFVAAMKMQAGLGTILKMGLTVAITLATIYTVPLIFSVTYYQANKVLLQKETETIAMLNYEKEEAGVEIGMTTVGTPSTETKLMLKVHNVQIPWYDLFYKIIYAPVKSNLTKIYEDYASNNLDMQEESFQLKSDTLYMDMSDLLNSSNVLFSSVFGEDAASLYQVTNQNLPASFYTPYYVILDSLINDINVYNTKNEVYSYTTSMYKGGRMKSLGLATQYFRSDEFIQDDTTDILNFREIYNLDMNSNSISPFEEADLASMRESQWLDINHSTKDVEPRIEKLNKEARKFILDNDNLLGKVSDDTFLKMMSLHLAMYHNKLFGVDGFQNIEIYNLSADDLTRLSVSSKEKVMEGSPLSFTRFIYQEGGDAGVYFAAVFSIITYVANWVKPIMTIAIFIALFVSFFVYRLLLRKETRNISGYAKIVGLLVALNLLYALVIKLSMFLPNIVTSAAACMLIQIIIHLLFLCAYIWVGWVTASNWRDLASDKLNITAANVRAFFTNSNEARKEEGEREAKEDPTSGWNKYVILKNRHKARKYTIRGRKKN